MYDKLLTIHQLVNEIMISLHDHVYLYDIPYIGPLIPHHMIWSYTMHKNLSKLNHYDMLIGIAL